MIDHSGMRLGRKDAAHDPRVPRLMAHMLAPTPKPAVDWTPAVKSWGMLGNDAAGDCTAAAVYHLIQLWCANNGIEFDPTTAQAIALYTATSDYPKEDDGASEIQVLTHWSTVGVPTSFGTDVAAFATLTPQNLDELKLSIEYFGGAYTGIMLPISAQTQDVWDVPAGGATGNGLPNSWGGHAVPLVAYDETGFTCVTWGAPKRMTNAFVQAYMEEAYAVVSRDWLADSGISPPGLNWAALQAEMKAITG